MSVRARPPLPARAVAAQLVDAVRSGHRSLGACSERLLGRAAPGDRALVQELAWGTLRYLPRLEPIATALLDRAPRRRDADLLALVLVGLYQLEYMRVPAHAAVASTVQACEALDKRWGTALINAILRRYTRERDALAHRLAGDPGFAHAHPPWLVAAVREAWPQHWQAILAAGNERPPLVLRVNARQATRAAYLARLGAAGLAARPAPHTEHGLILDPPVPVERLPGFATGAVSVQDGAAQLAATVLQPGAAQRILDACTAPGGKAAHLLESAPGPLRLVAVDNDAQRLARARATFARLHLHGVELHHADAADPGAWWDGEPFARILLDAPCTATGVIRRHPDIKILRRPGDLDALARAQARLLDALWPLLAVHGKLLYATCSVLPAENQDQIRAFLARQGDAYLDVIDARWGHDTGHGRQILPGQEGMDGFFYARLGRRSHGPA